MFSDLSKKYISNWLHFVISCVYVYVCKCVCVCVCVLRTCRTSILMPNIISNESLYIDQWISKETNFVSWWKNVVKEQVLKFKFLSIQKKEKGRLKFQRLVTDGWNFCENKFLFRRKLSTQHFKNNLMTIFSQVRRLWQKLVPQNLSVS
jgi:hypothetical protein